MLGPDQFEAGQLTGGEGEARVCRRHPLQPGIGHRGVLQLPEGVLQAGGAASQLGGSLAEHGGHGFRRIADPLRPDPDLMEVGVAGRLWKPFHRLEQARQRTLGQAGQGPSGRFGGGGVQHRAGGRLDHLVQQPSVPLGPQGAEELGAGTVALHLQGGNQRLGHLRIGKSLRGLSDSGGKHVGVANLAQRAAEPAQMNPQGLGPAGIDQLPEGAEIRAEAPGSDPGLVKELGVFVEEHARHAEDESTHRLGEGGSNDVGSRRVFVELAHHHVRVPPGGRAERPGQVSDGDGTPCAGLVQPVDQGIQERRVGSVHHLDPDLPETLGRPGTVAGGDPVVDHLRHPTTGGIDENDGLRDRAQPRYLPQGGPPGEGPDQLPSRGRHRIPSPRQDHPAPVDQVAALGRGQLDRPALTGAVPESAAPPGQAKIVGVVVDGFQVPVGRAHSRQTGQRQIGKREPGGNLELHPRHHRLGAGGRDPGDNGRRCASFTSSAGSRRSASL